MVSAAQSAIVRREGVLGPAAAAWRAVTRGQGARTILLDGAAGVGKSTAISQILEQVASPDVAVLTGHGAFSNAVPFCALRDVMPDLVEWGTRGGHRDLVDHVNELMSAAGHGRTGDVSFSRGDAMVEGMDQVLTAFTQSFDGVVIVMEDLHSADPESVDVLAGLLRRARRLRVLFVLSMRPVGPTAVRMATAVRQLAREGVGQIIEVGPMAPEHVAALCLAYWDRRPTQPFVNHLMEWTGGVALFVTELLRWYSTSGLLRITAEHVDRAPWQGSPPGKATLLFDVLEPNAAQTRLAQSLALFENYRPGDRAALAEVAGISLADVDELLDVLVGTGLLVAGGSNGEFRFRHPLIRAAAVDSLGPERRRRLHQILAEMLKGDLARIEQDPFEYALHVVESRDARDPSIVEACLAAGVAASAGAPLVAAQWFGRAALASPPDKAVPIRAAQTISLAVGADTVGAIDVGSAALAEAPPGMDRDELFFLTNFARFVNGQLTEALTSTRHEQRENPQNSSAIVIRLYLLQQLGRHGAALRVLPEAVKAAKSGRGTPLIAMTSALLLRIYFAETGDIAQAEQWDSRVRAVAGEVEPTAAAEVYDYLATVPFLGAGSFRRALADEQAANALRGQVVLRSAAGNAELARVILAYYSGDWDAAAERAEFAIAPDEIGGAHAAASAMRAYAALIALDRGQVMAARRLLAGLSSDLELCRGPSDIARARLDVLTGDSVRAIDRLSRRLQEQIDRGFRGLSSAIGLELVRTFVDVGDLASARHVVGQLDHFLENTRSPVLWAWRRAAAALAESDQKGLEKAARVLRTEGLLVEAAKVDVEALERGAQRLSAASSLDVLKRAGAVSWLARVRPYLEVAPRGSEPLISSVAERDSILRSYIEGGMTNRSIARAMNLSIKTVEAHVSALYRRMGCSNRYELLALINGSSARANSYLITPQQAAQADK